MFTRSCFASIAFIAATLTGAGAQASGEKYPDRPVHLIVPFVAGGTGDIIARIVGQALAEQSDIQIVVDNRPSAGGVVGTQFAARARPDGYTLTLGTTATHAIGPSLYKEKTVYDPIKDFIPIIQLGSTTSVLVVNPQVPVNSVKELIAYAKANPGKLNYASPGSGSPQHLSAVLFASLAGVNVTHIPYRGSPAAYTDLLTGRVQFMFDTLASAMPFVKEGKLKVLAVTSANRVPALPDLPTMEEAGLPHYQATSWYGLLAPRGTPPEAIKFMNNAVSKALAMQKTRDQLAASGVDPVGGTSEQFGVFIQSELKKWAKVVEESGAKVE